MTDWSTSCVDWEQRIVARETLITSPVLFPGEAAAALEMFDSLRLVDVPGAPTLGEAAPRWARDLAGVLFGSLDPETGRRLIRDYLLLIAKKNAKSTFGAAIMLTALLRNWRDSAEFVILSPTREASDNSFSVVRDMIRRDEDLAALLHVQEHVKCVTHRETGARLKVLAADADTVAGKKTTGVLVDELWLLGKAPRAESMLGEITGGLAARPEGFVLYMTTQSDDAPAGVWKQLLLRARKVRDGAIVDPAFMPLLYEFPPAMIEAGQHLQPENFYVANPSIGTAVDSEFLKRELSKATESGEESIRLFCAKHLNIEVGIGLHSDRWRAADYWLACGDPTLTLETLIERAEAIVIGVDGGGLDDLLAVAVLGRDAAGKWLHWGHSWAHAIALERRKGEASRLRDFESAGELTIVATPGADIIGVGDVIARCKTKLVSLAVDRAGITSVVEEARRRGVKDEAIVAVPQGWQLTGAIVETERALAAGRLTHSAQALMAWAIGNCKVEARGNALYITKAAAGRSKIDPAVALLTAAAAMLQAPTTAKPQLFFI